MKNIILKTITAIMGLIFIICACCLDSQDAGVFYIGCVISLVWGSIFTYANYERFNRI